MKVYTITTTCREEHPSRGRSFVALGNFDGLHHGHAAILAACRAGAARLDAIPGVFTFSTGKAPNLTTQNQRLSLFEAAGMEAVWLADFDALKGQSPRQFVEITLSKMGAVGVACGFNFRFGKGASGDVDTLRSLCAEYGIECVVLEPITDGGITVSSTEIRRRLSLGDMEGVAALMGRPWAIAGEVAHGRAVGGKLLSSPTMNLPINEPRLLPPYGVYFTRCTVNGIPYNAITNLGVRPTFGESELLAETHLLGAKGDFYGKSVQVEFLCFHRPERVFANPSELATTIAADIESAKRYFQTISTPSLQ